MYFLSNPCSFISTSFQIFLKIRLIRAEYLFHTNMFSDFDTGSPEVFPNKT